MKINTQKKELFYGKQYGEIYIKCPECNNEIVITKVGFPGGLNDYGNFEAQCHKCNFVFEISVDRDVDISHIKVGVKLLKKNF